MSRVLTAPRCAVIIPAYNRHEEVRELALSLAERADGQAKILVVDDGSNPPLNLGGSSRDIEVIRLNRNRGVAAARNAGVARARALNTQVAVMIDSDCKLLNDAMSIHLALHDDLPDVTAIGGSIFGAGDGFWARLDGVLSWVHSMPYGDRHIVESPYHLPTTNFSFKLNHVGDIETLFEERLITGEDAHFIRQLREIGKTVVFSPEPQIEHRDRTLLGEVIAHHFVWGYHQYFVQLGGGLSPRCFALWYRALFLLAFVPMAPIFALAGATLNLVPWLRARPGNLIYFPVSYLIWLFKAVAVIRAALWPKRCLRQSVELQD